MPTFHEGRWKRSLFVTLAFPFFLGSRLDAQTASSTNTSGKDATPNLNSLLSKTLTNDQVEQIVKSCPLLKANEIAEAYVKSRETLKKCPSAVLLDVQIKQVYEDYQTYQEKKREESHYQQCASSVPQGVS